MAGVDTVPLAATHRWTPVWQTLRAALVVVWATWAVAAWWSTPRAATVGEARADLSAGRMVAWEWVDSLDDVAAGWPTRIALTIGGGSSPHGLFVWRTTTGQVFHTAISYDRWTEPDGDASQEPVDERRSFEAALADTPVSGGEVVPHLPGLLDTVLTVVCLGVLIAGPPPVLGTRWFWFWVGTFDLGLGILVWLAAERPWATPDPPPPDPKTGKPRRYGGATGFVATILVGIAASILLAVLRAFPEWLVPSPLP